MVFGIGDLHLDFSKEKSMDVFGESWKNYEQKIFSNWNRLIKDDDLVLLPGDISWAMRLKDAYYDLKRVDILPGKKLIVKGNHDYWWESGKKMNSLNLNSIFYIQNNSFIYKNIAIVGTRGWLPRTMEGFNSHDEKMFSRELNRLELSLKSVKQNVDKKIVMLHYPPFNVDFSPNEFVYLMKDYDIDICIYGHLHSEGHKYIVENIIEGIEFHCVSSDYLDFVPKKLI